MLIYPSRTGHEVMLEIKELDAFYGTSHVLFGVDFRVGTGEVVALLGRNGMGKTTLVRTIMGILPTTRGSIRFQDQELRGRNVHEVARAGIALVPEGRHIFPNLTCEENLVAMAANRRSASDPWTLRRVYDLFPRLAERRGSPGRQLSGGEQQMLAIGRALMTNPLLLLLDEATEGLAPRLRQTIWDSLAELRSLNQAILVIDRDMEKLGQFADRQYILEKGRVVWQGVADAFKAERSTLERFLQVSGRSDDPVAERQRVGTVVPDVM
jgi:branched-chain amino acid transport system ATP-binding protein